LLEEEQRNVVESSRFFPIQKFVCILHNQYVLQTYDEPTYTETTAITRTSYTISPKTVDKEQEKKPEATPHRTGSPADEKVKAKSKDDQSFLRTQSEFIDRSAAVPPHTLLRSDEKSQIYEMPAEKLKRPSIEIQEPASDIRDDVIEMAGSKDDIRDRPVDVGTHVQALEPVAELPQSPAPSAKSTPHTTPKTSMKFKKDGKEMKPFEFGKSKFSSKHEVVKRGKDVEVKLENLKLGKEDALRVVVLPPMRNQIVASGATQPEVETKVKKSGSKYEISFKPTEVGTHKVFAYVNEIPHPLSPFPIRVYDSSEIIVGEIPARSNLNDTVEFTVDAGRAGFGNLEMAIKDADGIIIPSHVAQLESGTAKFLVTFTPTSKGQHTVNITFNKEVLKNSPFEVLITDPPAPLNESSKHKSVSKTSVTKIPSLSRVGQPSSIIVEVAGHDQLEIIITDNKKNQIGTEIIEIEPGVMQVNFTPQVVGDHDIEVKYGGVPVTAIPFTCRAYDPTKIKVGAIPKGLLDKPVYFTVDASEAGVGNLEVAVNDGRVPSMAHALGQHRYDISFVPKESADHTITIRFNNEPVPGSPFTCHLVSAAQASASGTGLERVPVDELTEIKIQTSASDAQPEVRVRDPQGNDLPVEITRSRQDETLYIATYTPKCVGNHQVDISMMGEPIAGSPFTAKAYDARMARLSQCDQAIVGKPCTFAIDAARAGAGNMEIIVSVDNRNVPNFVQAEGQAKFKVSFTPQEAKEHVISVRFNGVSVPGSPMRCMVENAPATSTLAPSVSSALTGTSPEYSIDKSSLAKDLRNAQVGQKRGFTIANPGGRAAECNVVVIAPNGSKVPTTTTTTGKESFYAEFTPTMKGTHEINIYTDKEKLNEMPILVVVGAGRASFPSTCLVGRRYSFDIEAENKDSVRVDIRDPQGRLLPVQIEQLPDKHVRASCRFREVGTHTVETFVSERPIGDRVQQRVVDAVNAVQLVSELKKEVVSERAEHKILIVSGLEEEVDVTVRDRDHNVQVVTLAKVSDTLWTASWLPKSEGGHELAISVAGMPIAGSPFHVPVLDPSAVRVIGLRNDRVGVEQHFNVATRSCPFQWITHKVEPCRLLWKFDVGPNSVPCAVKRVKPGLLMCSFTPAVSGLYMIDVHIDGLILPECPYECTISSVGAVRACGDALRRAQRGRVARFEVSLNDATRGELDVMISDPNGGPLPVRCYRQQDDSYWVEFTPEQTGTHTVEVTFGDVPVAGSPFRCEVVDPKKVKVRGLTDGLHLRHVTTINVDRRQAGDGDLTVEICDPTGTPLKVETLKSPSGEDRITFLPNQTGPHKVNVRVAGFQIPGYPQTIVVSEQPQPGVYGAAVDHSIKIDEPASLIFDPKGANGGLKVSVTGPRDNKVRHKVIRRPNGTSEVVFSPEEVGAHIVNIDFNNKPIAGSPFTVRVVDPSKVVVNDLDMDRDGSFLLRLGQQNVFDVDATAAGPGKLRAEVRNSESALLGEGPAVDDLGYGKYRVAFTPKQPGRYSIYLYWNELPVESAFPVRARSSDERATTSRETVAPITSTHARDKSSSSMDDDVSRVVVRGDGLHRAQLKEPNESSVTAATWHVATYTPLTGGTYELHILWNGTHVKGSPFKVNADTSSSPAELISVDSTSLKIGIINEDIKTVIDTRRAGPGQLSAQCMGPVKLAYCELYDHRDGTYTLSVRPTEVGKHTLVIKYNDQHVRGSPYLIHVSMPPDPSKVRVYGPGIEHGILSLFKSNFVVETRGAGAGQLTVRVRGPKGAFNVEMQREKKNERTIHCKYEPKEPGDYQVEVKWHGEHVPGSPFLVMIVDTEQELSRFLRGEAPSPTPATPFVPPGWVGPPPLFPPPMGQRYGPPLPMGPMGPMGPPPPPGAMMPFNAPPPPRHKAKYH
ncbi:Filamin/ABP280 repeat protein, partial [Ostertagia ostertagi]